MLAERILKLAKKAILAGAVLVCGLTAGIAAAQAPGTGFDHDATGFHLDGAHIRALCASCHTNGVLRGTPKECRQCHTIGNRTSTNIVQNITHLSIIPGTRCDVCHISNTTFRTWRMDHTATSAPCTSCHTGQNFEGTVPLTKPATHLQTTSNCSVCHGSTSTFTVVTAYDHSTVAAGTCTNCHNGGTANGKPIGHIQTSQSCDVCHFSFASFALGTMDHVGISTGCVSCHGGQSFTGVTPMSKPTGHLPTTVACEVCHTSTQVPGGFAVANTSYNHAAVAPGTCTTCHNGTNATGKASGHIPTSAACDTCHNKTDPSFGNGTMNHAGIVSGCSTCHNGQNFVGLTPVAKPAGTGHITTSQDCSICHSNKTIPGGFATWTMNHTGITTGCSTCHNTGAPYAGIVTKPASGHVPTAAACETCHPAAKTAVGEFASGVAMSHTGITTGCASCHDTGKSFTGMAVVTKPVAGHIPTSAPCEWCHRSTTTPGGFAQWTMNHTGISGNCNQCHGTTSQLYPGVMNQLPSHLPTGAQDCAACHTSTQIGGFSLSVSNFDHVKAGVKAGTCTTCHNGTTASGPVTGHITVNGGTQCDSCHNYTLGSFSKWTLDHTKVSASCSSCHNTGNSFPGATLVTFGSVNHFPTTAECSNCHTSTKVTGGFKTWTMNHTSVAATSCATCHDTGKSFGGAVTVVTKPASGHIVTTAACDTCHTSTATGGFKTWTMNHGAVVATPCATCHNTGVSFLPGTPPLVTKPTGAAHIPTSAACNACHTSTQVTGGFAVWTMDHTGIVSGCKTCHGTTTQLYPAVMNQPAGHVPTGAVDCNACHTSTAIGGFAIVSVTNNPHTVTAPSATCTNCHNGTAAMGLIGGHIAVNGGVQCGSCHDWHAASFATRTMDHTKVSAACSTCHATGKSFPGAAMVTQGSVSHIATTKECSTCHSSTTVPGGFRTWTMNHTGIAGSCNTCHAAGSSFTNTSGPTLVTIASLPPHIAVTGDCSACHSSTSTGGFATATMNHSAVNTATCQNCHGGQAFTNVTVKAKPGTHITTTGDCNACHSSFTSFAGGVMNHSGISANCASCHGGTAFFGVTPVTKPASHIAVTGDCSVCHTRQTIPGGFSTWTMNHTGVNTATCAGCHGAGKATAFQGATVVVPPATHMPVTGDCSVCHTSTTVPGGFTLWNMNHAGVNTATCQNCHTGQVFATGVTPKVKPAGHVATTADCGTCHTNLTVPGGFATAIGGHVHALADAGKCATCHNGTVARAKITGHIPTTSSCDVCHTVYAVPNPTFATWTMNHSVVSGTSCATCHNGQTVGSTTNVGKPASHIATLGAADCNTCHSNQTVPGGFTTWTMNHTGVSTATCTNCHGGQTFATGVVPVAKGANHITTSKDCLTCHSGTASFAGGRMGGTEHVANGNTASCIACHNGQVFQGVTPVAKPATHIVTASDCATCHSTSNFTTFRGTWTMNHTGVNTATCQNCHSNQTFATGVVPVSKPANHVATTSDCFACHSSTTTFSLSSMNHNGIVSGCQNCHNGQTFQGVVPVSKPANHIATLTAATDCAVCHANTKTFTAWTMNHTGVSTATCTNCHGNQSFATGVVPVAKGANHITTSKDCMTCHSGTSTFAGGRMGAAEHTANGNTASCLPCHNGQTFQGVTPVTKAANHITTSKDCITCHSSTATFAGGRMGSAEHTANGNTTTCIACHNGQTFQGVTPVNKANTPSPGHVPTAADCANCHGSTTTFTSFKKPQAHNASLLIGFASTACYPCHGNTTRTWSGVKNWSGGHPNNASTIGKSCGNSGCHSQTNFTQFQH